MGAAAEDFDDELKALLGPHAKSGVIIYKVRSNLTSGRLRLQTTTGIQ